MSWRWAQGTWELRDTHQMAAQGLVSPAGLSRASDLGPANLVPSLPQGSPGVKGAAGPVGPPGASVSGPPVRAPSVLHTGMLLGLRALLPGRGHGADLACGGWELRGGETDCQMESIQLGMGTQMERFFFFLKTQKWNCGKNALLESGPPGWNSRPATYWCVALGKLSDASEPHFPHLEDGSITGTWQRYCQDYK